MKKVRTMEEFIRDIEAVVPGKVTRMWLWQKGFLLIEAPEGKHDPNNPYYLMAQSTGQIVSFSPQATNLEKWLRLLKEEPLYRVENKEELIQNGR